MMVVIVFLMLAVLLFIYYKPTESLRINAGRTVTFHYTDWCPGCKAMKPIWEQVKRAGVNSGITFQEVNEDKARTPGITTIPAIYMVTEKGHITKYVGPPVFEHLHDWVMAPVTQQ